jgi:non-ribosomal peptide synthetase component F
VANRGQRETENLVGFFVNQMVIRADLSGDPSFTEVLSRIRRTALDAMRNQAIPFERLVEQFAPRDHNERAPLFSVKLVVDNDPVQTLTVRGLVMEREPVMAGISKLDLTVFVVEGQRGIQVAFEYSEELFDRDRIESMMRDYEAVLQQISSNAGAPISSILLPSATSQGDMANAFRDAASTFI